MKTPPIGLKYRQVLIAGGLGLLLSFASAAAGAAEKTGELATALANSEAALQAGKLAEAEAALAPHTGVEAASAAALARLGEVRRRQARAAEYVELIDRAIALEPENARWHSLLGQALSMRVQEVQGMEQGEIAQRMLASFARAVELDPELIEGYIGLARYHTYAPDFAGGSRVRAEQLAEEVRKRVPWLGELELGNIALHFGDAERAATHLGRANELQPGEPAVQQALGRLTTTPPPAGKAP